MDVTDAIHNRRAFRSLAPVSITQELLNDFATCAQLSASCFNNQPWRFIFVYEPDKLGAMKEALSSGNEWAHDASLIIVVLSKKDYDCVIHDRVYYQFDTGMATAHIILRATELGLIAHPIAGYSPRKTRAILNIPDDLEVLTLVIVGKHASTVNPNLSEKQKQAESHRPARHPVEEFVFHNSYQADE